MRRLIAAPIGYVAWTAIVILALVGTYPVDPYVFGFTTLGLAWLTGAVALAGILACFLRETSRAAKAVILVSVLIAAGAVAVALDVLSGFSWA